jgi:hypothetical protein
MYTAASSTRVRAAAPHLQQKLREAAFEAKQGLQARKQDQKRVRGGRKNAASEKVFAVYVLQFSVRQFAGHAPAHLQES